MLITILIIILKMGVENMNNSNDNYDDDNEKYSGDKS